MKLPKRFFTISNAFSLLRLFLAIPMYFMIVNSEQQIYVLFLAFLCYLTDLLDGYFARAFNQVTEWGKILDPIADKVLVAAICIALLFTNKLPIWYIGIVLGRDILILIAGLLLSTKISFVLPSTYIGKATVVTIGLSLVISYIHPDQKIIDGSYVIAIIMIAGSLLHYAQRMIISLRNSRQNGTI